MLCENNTEYSIMKTLELGPAYFRIDTLVWFLTSPDGPFLFSYKTPNYFEPYISTLGQRFNTIFVYVKDSIFTNQIESRFKATS